MTDSIGDAQIVTENGRKGRREEGAVETVIQGKSSAQERRESSGKERSREVREGREMKRYHTAHRMEYLV